MDGVAQRRRLRRSNEGEVKRRPKQQLHGHSPRRRGLEEEATEGAGAAILAEGAIYQELPEPLAPLPVPSRPRPSRPSRAESSQDDLGIAAETSNTSGSRAQDEAGDALPTEASSEKGEATDLPPDPSRSSEDVPKQGEAATAAPVDSSDLGDLTPAPAPQPLEEEPRPDTPALEELVLELTKSSTDPPTKPAVPAAPPASPCGKGAVAALASQKAKQREFPEVLDDGAAQSGSSRCGGSMCGDFPFCTARCPFLVACLTLVATPLLLILLWPGLVINSDTSVFLEADSRSSSIRSAFLGALPFRDAEAEGRRLMTGLMPHIDVKDMYKMDHLILYWSTTDPKGLLQEKYLRPMRALELSLRNGPLYQLTCHEMSTPGLGAMCDPGHSVVNAAYPSEAVNASETDPYIKKPMDGRGTELLRPDVIQKVISEKDDYKELMLPRNYQDGDVVMMARSYFGWNMLCCRIDVPNSVRGAELMRIRGVWDKLLATEVIPKLVDFQQKNLLLQRNLRLNFDGGGVSTMQLWDVLQSDCLFAIGSVLFIITYLTIHAGSPLLSCGSMLLTMLAIPMAFLVTALVSGSNEVTGAAFLSIFLIAGLGADVVLVFINFWARSKTSTPEPPTPCTSTAILGARKRQRDANSTFERVKYVYRHAGLACLGTTLTTAASFFANLASVLRALREFGFFMGMCILGAYLYLLLVLPALLILNDCLTSLRCSKRCAEACAGGVRRLCRCRPPSSKGLCERLILAYRRCCFLFFLILVVAFGVWTGTVARLDVGVPQMFPDGHNLNDVEDIAEDFLAASERWTRDELRICNFLVHEDRRNFMQCAVHQCQITLEGPLTFMGSSDRNGSAECDCFPSELESSQCHMVHPGEEGYILIRVRVVGDVPHEAIEQWRGTAEFRDYAMQAAILANPMLQSEIEAGMNKSFFRWARSGPGHALQQEFWETGEIITTNYEVLANFAIPVKRTDRSIQVCHADRLCYCGAAICTYPGRRLVDPVIPDIFFLQRLTIPLLVAPTVPPRLLLAADVAVTEGHPGHFAFGPSVAPMATAPAPFGRRLQGGVDVSLVWGLRTNDLMPLLGQPERAWHFEAAFRMDAPSTQRQLFAACSLGKDKPELLVQETACWVKNFRSYVKMAGLPFPLQSTWFQSTFSKFVDGRVLPSGILVKDYMWLAENFELKATYVQFTVGLNYMTAQSSTILSLMQEWDNVVDEINQNAPPELGSTWHTSSLWIRAEAELAIVNSTVLTMLVSAICGFLGALFFTHWDPFLSLMVVVNVIGVTLALAWFMMVLMGWAVGVLEVLGLIVFVGYSITYTLHIAHKYQEHILSSESIQLGRRTRERRTLAVSYALRSMSGSIVGSAITTLGSSFFLFFCQLVIFVKLATVLFSVTFFACVFATFAFPAALLCVGPVGTSCEVLPQLWKSYSAPGSDGPDHPRVHSEAECVQMSSKLAKKIVVDDGVASHVFLASGSTSSLPRRSSDAAQEKRPRKSQDLAITVL